MGGKPSSKTIKLAIDVEKQLIPITDEPNLKQLFLMSQQLGCDQLNDIILTVLSKQLNVGTLTATHNHLTDLPSNLSKLTQLTSLDVHHNQLSTFPKVLECCTSIEQLDVCANEIKDLHTWPSKMPFITSLRIGINPIHKLDEFSALRFPKLQKLFIFELPFPSLVGLPDHQLLTNLDLDNCKLMDLVGLPSLPSLVWLLLRSNGLTSLEGMHALPRLQYLFLNQNKLTTIKQLKGCTALKWLLLPGNDIKHIDLTLDLLIDLNLDGNVGFKDLKSLDRFTALRKLSLDGIDGGMLYLQQRHFQ